MAIEPRTGLEIFGPVGERSTALYTATLVTTSEDGAGDQIPVPGLTSLALTIYDLESNAVIRPRGSVLNENDGTFSNGVLTVKFSASDNIIRNGRKQFEDHVAVFHYTFGAGEEGHHGVVIRVKNLGYV
jgi:hypothetical protein